MTMEADCMAGFTSLPLQNQAYTQMTTSQPTSPSLHVEDQLVPEVRRNKRASRSKNGFTEVQIAAMEKRFTEKKYITVEERTELARDVGLKESQVMTWFQNRRSKFKRRGVKDAAYTGKEDVLAVLAANRVPPKPKRTLENGALLPMSMGHHPATPTCPFSGLPTVQEQTTWPFYAFDGTAQQPMSYHGNTQQLVQPSLIHPHDSYSAWSWQNCGGGDGGLDGAMPTPSDLSLL